MGANIWAPGSTPETNTNTTRVVEEFVAIGGQTLFVLTQFLYSPGTQSLEVYKNGLLVSPSLVTEDSAGDRFSLAACALNDKITAVGLVGIVGNPSVPEDGSVTTAKLASGLVVPVSKGGTGATDAANARANLGVTPANIGALDSSAIGNSVQAYDADTAKTDVKQQWTAQQTPFKGTLTDAGSIDWDCDVTGQVAKVTLGGNRALNAPTNVVEGTYYILRVTQDATGNRTLSYNTAYKFGTAGAPAVTPGASKVSILGFIGGTGNTMEYTGCRLDAV